MSGNSERPREANIKCARCNRKLKAEEVLGHQCRELDVMQYQFEQRVAEKILENVRMFWSIRTPCDRNLEGLLNERER